MKWVYPVLILTSLIASNLSGFDASSDVSQDYDSSTNKTDSRKKDMSNSTSKTKDSSKTKTKTKSKTSNIDLKYEAQLDVLKKIAKLEKTGVYPFSACRILTKPMQAKDFGLSCKTGSGYINTGRCSFLSESAKNYASIENVLPNLQSNLLRGYMTCSVYYGAVIAQYLKTDELDFEITDENIKSGLDDSLYDIYMSECSLNGAETKVLCGSLSLDLNPLTISQYGVQLFSNSGFYGYSLSKSTNRSLSRTIARDTKLSKSKSQNESANISYDTTNSQSIKISKKATSSISVGKFVD